MEAQIVYLHIYNFIEGFVRIIAYFSQLLVFIGGAVVMEESFPLPFLVLVAGEISQRTYCRLTGDNHIVLPVHGEFT